MQEMSGLTYVYTHSIWADVVLASKDSANLQRIAGDLQSKRVLVMWP